ncbi:hypothetical protein BN135_1498 [Cronobacter muytjensii 530]
MSKISFLCNMMKIDEKRKKAALSRRNDMDWSRAGKICYT